MSQRPCPALFASELELDTHVPYPILHDPARRQNNSSAPLPFPSPLRPPPAPRITTQHDTAQRREDENARVRYSDPAVLLPHKLDQLAQTVEEGDHRLVEPSVEEEPLDGQVRGTVPARRERERTRDGYG